MSRVALDRGVFADIDRIIDHLLAHEVVDAESRINAIVDALDILQQHPLIGRPTKAGLRKLVIGRDAGGYVARYRFDRHEDTVHVLALRAQRESGFVDD